MTRLVYMPPVRSRRNIRFAFSFMWEQKALTTENNLAYMKFLKQLGVTFEQLIVEDVPHSAKRLYEKQGRCLDEISCAQFLG